MILSSLLLTMAAASPSAANTICSEVCIMQREQAAIAEIMNNTRPPWAITLFRDMEDYIACGEQSFAKGSIVAFENYDEIDRRFDRAAVDCADNRDAVTLLANRDFLADGTFASADEAAANIERVRAMAFAFAMVRKFGSTRRDSAAEKYAESRFPELVSATRDRRNTVVATESASVKNIVDPAADPMNPPAIVTPALPLASRSAGADLHEGWNPLKPDPFIADSPADAMKWQLRGFPESLEGNQKLEMRIEKIPGGMLAVSVIQEGLLDDSTAATWTYAELAPRDDGKWDVTMKGEKWRCARSGSDEWVITPCP